MSKTKISLLVSFLLLSLVGLVSAQSLPGGGWSSDAKIQNASASTANVAFDTYTQAGVLSSCGSNSVASGGAILVSTASDCSVAAGFVGSAVVSSDQPVVAMASIYNSGTAAAHYGATDGSDASTTISFPLMKNQFNGRTSVYYIQNTGSSAADITATWTLRASDGGTTHTSTYNSVPANAMVIVTPADASPAISTGVVGGLSLTGTEKLAGTLLETQTGAATENLQGTRAFTPGDYDIKVYCPLVRNNHTSKLQTTGVQVQNVDSATQTITITYSTGQSNSASVPAGASHTFPTRLDLPAGVKAAATLTSGGNIVAIVSDKGLTTSNPERVTTYMCFPDNSATTTAYIPQAIENKDGSQTGVQVQNVGSAATTFTATIHTSAGTVVLSSTSVAAGGEFTFNRESTDRPTTVVSGSRSTLAGKNNSIVITASQPFVSIANESTISGTVKDTKNYEGISK